MKRTRLRSRSKRGAERRRKRREFAERILRERPRCQAKILPGCKGRSEHPHEPLMRSQGGSILDDDNVLAVWFNRHVWIHNHSAEAKQRGLLRSRPPEVKKVGPAVL